MNKIVNILMLLWLGIFCSTAMASDKLAAKCVAGVCIKSPLKDSEWLLKEYGLGQIRKDDDDHELIVHCYYDARQKLWIELEFSRSGGEKTALQLTGVFVTGIEMCPTRFSPKKAFPDLVSEQGVKIGSAESEILNKMGSPKRIDDVKKVEERSPYLKDSSRYSSRFGSHRLVYDDNPSRLLFNFYGLENGRLVSMWFADRE